MVHVPVGLERPLISRLLTVHGKQSCMSIKVHDLRKHYKFLIQVTANKKEKKVFAVAFIKVSER